ncbi:hypothetical protein ACFOWX_12645 [Sphingorhabdus arenilitoris]|uniref:Uncharacterized protein n=1 Tax=Sphingorhabdus arenilitoris TaxID=1490041 RepID=A0ABV8RJ32_9SPHN
MIMKHFIRLITIFTAVFSISNIAEAKSGELQAECAAYWQGTWQMSAEGRPVRLFTLGEDRSGNEMTGRYSGYGNAVSTFEEAELTEKVVSYPLSKVHCNGNQIIMEYVLPDGETNSFTARYIDSDEGWLALNDLPPEYTSPKYRFRRIADNDPVTLQPVKPQRLAHDIWGVDTISSNQETARIFEEDQAIRNELSTRIEDKIASDEEFFKRWESGDAERLARTKQLLENGELKAGVDYYRAAFIFQHGNTPEDYLRAHHLAVIAVSLGYKQALWISAATLDRYLLNIGKKQIYGTQYRSVNDVNEQIEFDQAVVSDAERKMLSVPVLDDQ